MHWKDLTNEQCRAYMRREKNIFLLFGESRVRSDDPDSTCSLPPGPPQLIRIPRNKQTKVRRSDDNAPTLVVKQ